MKQFELPEPVDDGLFIPEVGPWSRDKHHFLRRYLDAFTTSMNPKAWKSLHYVDLFSGAGIERLTEVDQGLRLDWGSPLIAAQLPRGFDRLHLVEMEDKRFAALSARIAKFPAKHPPQLLQGDANIFVDAVVREIPSGSLSVAFLDPFGLHLHFSTLKKLAARRMDFIIFFPDHTDALRNWELLYEEDTNSNLDLVLGHAPWREEKRKTPQDGWSDMLTRLYEGQIRTLGYQHFSYERICRTDGRHLYKLIFCCKDKAGGTIWNNISRQKRSGQRGFDFGV
jgi:three-Cys-motif partner protein